MGNILYPSLTVISCCCTKRGERPSEDFETMAVRLAGSIRKNGGLYRNCKIVFYSDERKPSEITIERLKSLGCELVFGGKTPIPDYPGSNKFLACCVPFDTDYALWMDTDIYVLGDFSEIFNSGTDVIVSPDARSWHPWTREEDIQELDKLYKHFGLERPPLTIISHQDRKRGNLSFEGGLFAFKNSIDFGKKFWEVYKDILNSGIIGTLDNSKRFPFDFVAIPFTIVKHNFSFSLIPEKYHYYYGLHNHRLEGDVRVVHYQGVRVAEVPDEDWEVQMT